MMMFNAIYLLKPLDSHLFHFLLLVITVYYFMIERRIFLTNHSECINRKSMDIGSIDIPMSMLFLLRHAE